MLHAGGHHMPMERQLRMWHLEVCSQSADEDTWLSKGAAKLLRHEKHCHVEDGVCSWANHKIIITAGMPDMKDVSPYTWLDKHNEIPRTKVGTKYVGTLTPLEGIRTLFGKSLSEATRGPIAHQGNQGLPGAQIQPNFLSLKILEKGNATELHHIGLAKQTRQRLVPGGIEGSRGRQEVYFTLV